MDRTLNIKPNRRLTIMKQFRLRLKIKPKLSKITNKVMWILPFNKTKRQASMKRKKIKNKIKTNKYRNK
jgi:hypothetical protein